MMQIKEKSIFTTVKTSAFFELMQLWAKIGSIVFNSFQLRCKH